MAAYAALVSVLHIIQQLQHHPRPSISLDETQVQSLTENVALERYPHDGSEEADGLESRIADAAFAAEDVIESHIVDQIAGGSTSYGENISPVDLYEGLQKVIEDMGFIKKKVMNIIEEKSGIQNQLNRNSMPAGLQRSPSTGRNTMVGFDDLLYELMDKLTGRQLERQIVPIFGMGGSGKTTLARYTFMHEIIVQHFDILAWATISQEYSIREILLEIICRENKEGRKELDEKSEYELGEILYKRLSGRRYLIVMDDMWVTDVWDKINHFFPINSCGSRIVITTRLASVAFQLTKTHGLEMKFLDKDESWNLLCKNVFGEEGCPLELEKIGKKIAKNCRGLPLSIVVIGRVLAKSRQTQEFWEYIAENLSSIVNLDDNEHCLKILSTSYNQLPVHLKPCFMYMAIFNKDSVIRVSTLIKLWVAEGFLKPISGKSLEEVAEEYLKNLIDRNLIFIHKRGSNGKIKFCTIHDLLRDLCLRQAQREKFICVASQYNPDIPQANTQRRIAFHQGTSRHALESLQTMSLARSLICKSHVDLPLLDFRLLRVLNSLYLGKTGLLHSFDFRLLRVVKPFYPGKARILQHLDAVFSRLINLRHLAVSSNIDLWIPYPQLFPPSFHLLWNVHSLIVKYDNDVTAPLEIWKMTQLRHVEFQSLILLDPPRGCTDGHDDFVLGNLQTLLKVKNFRCCEEVVKRIPHVKKLQVMYDGAEGWSISCFENRERLKLESLSCSFSPLRLRYWTDFLQSLTFPQSLKKLTLQGCRLRWEDITTKIGSLPLLQVLKLKDRSTRGHKWETVDEGFVKLKFLRIGLYNDCLECWTTDSTHFPTLEHLVLDGLGKLEKIPSELGNISTLKLIELIRCRKAAVISAKEMLDEQEELGNVDLQVRVLLMKGNEELESFGSRNFQVEVGFTGLPLHWKDVTTKIGSVPLLQVLKLEYMSTIGHMWETVEEGFPKLKFMKIVSFSDIPECWPTDSNHFPVLERLVLVGLRKSEKIPSE